MLSGRNAPVALGNGDTGSLFKALKDFFFPSGCQEAALVLGIDSSV